jgi:hypothetical protein
MRGPLGVARAIPRAAAGGTSALVDSATVLGARLPGAHTLKQKALS